MRKIMWALALTCCLTGGYGSPYFTNGFVKTGTYECVGKGIDNNPYSCRVIIENYGKNYRVIWKENFCVLFTGIGILRGDVFCVSFSDLDSMKKGIFSYEMISNFELEGDWAGMDDHSRGLEKLTFISPYTD